MKSHRSRATACVIACLGAFLISEVSIADELTLEGSFSAGVGELVGVAYDPGDDSVWVHGSLDADLRRYAPDGTFLSSVPRPGEAADDIDLEFAPEGLSLAGTPIPGGTLLVISGETGTAEIYAVDKATGVVLATLNTAFGASHVVGGAYHARRNTFFLVQDRQATGTASDSLVAEIDPVSGAVIGQFKIDSALPGYTINFGDVEASAATGNLLLVSSDETPLAEFTPGGEFVQLIDRPAGPASLSGIGIDDAADEAWVSGTGGSVWRLGGLPGIDRDSDGVLNDPDNCPYFANPEQTDTDADDRGDACECTDQDGNGGNTVSDLLAINLAIFTPALVTPLCDGNDDAACNVTDIIAANIEIFSPENTSTCARQPVSGP